MLRPLIADSDASAGVLAQAPTPNPSAVVTEWLHYGGDKAGSKYALLAQIDAGNFTRVKVAWSRITTSASFVRDGAY